jgi:hypothetical protein
MHEKFVEEGQTKPASDVKVNRFVKDINQNEETSSELSKRLFKPAEIDEGVLRVFFKKALMIFYF